ncbi:transcription regulator protein [Vibrio ishigakensis]|uniref:Transcription regulator protein n=1 Tax=Vibrio ishigakensis TaxID=1481914 RepID=A0A0B8PQK3_9VIBR|nr:transcription regulator protein [Vibrio ishigakensis]
MHNYKLLKPLLILLQTRSLTESAHKLNVTQSAMSRTLAQIREAFADPILVRQGKGFVVTARGEELLKQLPLIIESLDKLYAAEQFEPKECAREFRLAYTAFLSEHIAPLICLELEKQAPKSSLHSLLWQQQNLGSMLEDSVELLATTLDTFPENIYGKKLIQDEYVVVMNKDNPLTNKPLTITDYLDAKHITVHGMQEMKQAVKQVFVEHQQSRHILTKVPSFDSAMEVARQSKALITAPLHIAGNYPDLHIANLPFRLPSHSYYLLWHAKHQKDLSHRWFRELCFKCLQIYLKDAQARGHKRLS